LWLALQLAPALAPAADWSARPLSEVAVYPEFRVSAQVLPAEEARLAAEVSARVVRLPVRVGMGVGKGAVLAELDASQYRIDVARAQAQADLTANRIRLAESQLAQGEALAAKGFVSPEALRVRQTEVAVLKSELAAARQTVAAARLALARTTIRAPFAGVVKERSASIGDLAGPGTPLVVLAAVQEPELRAAVPAEQLAGLEASSPRLVAGELAVPVTVRRVSPLVDKAGQTREVIFAAAAPLPPGLAGEVRWASRQPWLPAGFVQRREGRLGAYLERDGQAVFVALPQAQVGRPVAVDWPADTRVIDTGRQALGAAGEGAR
jgi:RND family efflux transporter MFP subunit